MQRLPAFFVPLSAVKTDPALPIGARGARKLLVTDLYPTKEEEATDDVWAPPGPGEKCPVQVMRNTEVAVFTQRAWQDRHYHCLGTEIYMVLEGRMKIEVAGKSYSLVPGDMIVVNANAIHQVKPEGTEFICRVVTVNCGGASDKCVV
jgi:mannose-6-phosphate isomerase-like protein (cupin superfamily)